MALVISSCQCSHVHEGRFQLDRGMISPELEAWEIPKGGMVTCERMSLGGALHSVINRWNWYDNTMNIARKCPLASFRRRVTSVDVEYNHHHVPFCPNICSSEYKVDSPCTIYLEPWYVFSSLPPTDHLIERLPPRQSATLHMASCRTQASTSSLASIYKCSSRTFTSIAA